MLVRYNSVFVPLCSPNTCKDVFNTNVTAFQSNCAEGLHFSAFHFVLLFLNLLSWKSLVHMKVQKSNYLYKWRLSSHSRKSLLATLWYSINVSMHSIKSLRCFFLPFHLYKNVSKAFIFSAHTSTHTAYPLLDDSFFNGRCATNVSFTGCTA